MEPAHSSEAHNTDWFHYRVEKEGNVSAVRCDVLDCYAPPSLPLPDTGGLRILKKESKDTLMSTNYSALTNEGDPEAKRVTEVIQNAIDPVVKHVGGVQTGGWGEGMKVVIARWLKLGYGVDILVRRCVDATSPSCFVSADSARLLVQNVSVDRFTRDSMYLGHSEKGDCPDDRNAAGAGGGKDATLCYDAILSSSFFPTSLPSPSHSPGSPYAATLVMVDHGGKEEFTASAKRAFFRTGVSEGMKEYPLVRCPEFCLTAHVLFHSEPTFRSTVYSQGLFVDTKCVSHFGEWSCDVAFHIVGASVTSGRDRKFTLHYLRHGTNVDQSAFLSKKGEGGRRFAEEVMFRPGFGSLLFAESLKEGSNIAGSFVSLLLHKFKASLFPIWPPRVVPIFKNEVADFEETFSSSEGYSMFVGPDYYSSFFDPKKILTLKREAYKVMKKDTEVFLDIKKTMNKVCKQDFPRGEMKCELLRLHVSSYVLAFLSRHGSFAHDKLACEYNIGILAKEDEGTLLFYIPSDLAVSTNFMYSMLKEFNLVHPSAWDDAVTTLLAQKEASVKRKQERDRREKGKDPALAAEQEERERKRAAKLAERERKKEEEEAAKAEKEAAKAEKEAAKAAKEGKRGGKVGNSKRGAFCMAQEYRVGDGFGFGVRQEGEDVTEEMDFHPYSLSWEEGQIVLKLEKKEPLLDPETKRVPMSNLLTRAKSGMFFYPIGFVTPTCDFLPACSSWIHAKSLFPSLDPRSSWVASSCVVTGWKGYVATHMGGLDDPSRKLNCISSAIRLCSLLSSAGFHVRIYQTRAHAFAAVYMLGKWVYVETAESDPSPYTDALAERIDALSHPSPSKPEGPCTDAPVERMQNPDPEPERMQAEETQVVEREEEVEVTCHPECKRRGRKGVELVRCLACSQYSHLRCTYIKNLPPSARKRASFTCLDCMED